MILKRRTMGNTTPARMPVFKLSPAAPDTRPTNVGPTEQPKSPASARNANMAVPPRLMDADAILKVPGHKMPTDKPHSPQPMNPKMGIGDREIIR